MATVIFEIPSCTSCGYYSNGGGQGEPYCKHPENPGAEIANEYKVPDNCPALFSTQMNKLHVYSIGKWKAEKGTTR